MVKASIIVPVFNKWDLTRGCLESLRRTVPQGMAEVIVVDNASSDETADQLPGGFPEVRYLRQDENTGYARGNDIGATQATADLLVLLNNDTITEPNWLEPILEVFDTHAQTAVVGSKLLYPDRHIQHAGVAFNANRDPFIIYRNAPADFRGVNQLRQYPAVTGACFSVPRAVYQDFGGLREDYLNGYEDVDFCLRVRAAGWEIWYQPQSVVFHLESQTPGRKRFEAENRALFFERWRDKIVPDAERYYREDVGDARLFPLLEWMTHGVAPAHYLPTRWRTTDRTSGAVRSWLERLQTECPPPVDVVESEGPFEGAVGEVRNSYRYLGYSIALTEAGVGGGDDVAGTLSLAPDGTALGHDRLTGRQVTFPPGMAPSMSRQLFSMNLRVNHPRWLLETGLRHLSQGLVDGDIYAREFATLWSRSPECLQFRTEHLLRQGKVDVALEALQSFYEEDRYNTYATLQLAEVLTRKGEVQHARDILDAFLRVKPAHLRARWLRWRAAG